jgi:hypothetical protein
MIARLDLRTRGRTRRPLKVVINKEWMHLFDRDTDGARIDSGER